MKIKAPGCAGGIRPVAGRLQQCLFAQSAVGEPAMLRCRAGSGTCCLAGP